jgi:hypothetical protein
MGVYGFLPVAVVSIPFPRLSPNSFVYNDGDFTSFDEIRNGFSNLVPFLSRRYCQTAAKLTDTEEAAAPLHPLPHARGQTGFRRF